MHCCATLETESSEYFLKGRVGIDVRRDSLTRHVVVHRALVEIPELRESVGLARLPVLLSVEHLFDE